MKFINTDMKTHKTEILELMVDNFYDDPLYVHIFEDEHKRKACLKIFFESYIRYLGSSALISISEDMQGIGLAFDSEKAPSKIKTCALLLRFIIEAALLIKVVGFSGYIRCLKTISVMSSVWIDELNINPYLHLDLMVVNKAYRGRGYFKFWLDTMEDHAKQNNATLTLETQNIINVKLYEKYGFKLIREIKLKNTNITQYCMTKSLCK